MSREPERTLQAIDGEAVEAIARRVAELLASAATGSGYLDTAAVAQMLGVSDEWVRDHAAELGAIRLGDGRRGQLRFEVERVRRALESRRLKTAPRRRSPRRATRRASSVRLLPLPDSAGPL